MSYCRYVQTHSRASSSLGLTTLSLRKKSLEHRMHSGHGHGQIKIEFRHTFAKADTCYETQHNANFKRQKYRL